jgi:putative resolvase
LKGVDTLSKYYSIHEFSKIIGVSAQTLRNWDANGKLHPHHTTVSGYRYYSDEQLNQVINVKPKNRITIINKKMIWNDRSIMLKHIFWQKDSRLR